MQLIELWDAAHQIKRMAIGLLSRSDNELANVDELDDYIHECRPEAMEDPVKKLLPAACDFLVLKWDDLTAIDILTYQNLLDEIKELENECIKKTC